MATKKQRRRREKDRRHDWEFVYVDEEGREVEADEEPEAAQERKTDSAKARPPARSGGRVIQPPSWQRVLKRGLIFAPIMFLVISFMSRKLSLEAKILNTAILMAFFVPFSYLLDTLMYRSYRKRSGGAAGPSQRKR